MAMVYEINGKRLFTLEEARRLLPIVRRITKTAYENLKNLRAQLDYVEQAEKRSELEKKMHRAFDEWQEKVYKLGCEAKGMWLVDFDSGDGYYCWHYPENDICFFHSYSEGFRGRVRIH